MPLVGIWAEAWKKACNQTKKTILFIAPFSKEGQYCWAFPSPLCACADEGQSEGRRSKRTTAGKHPKHDGVVEGKSKRGGNTQKKKGLTISAPIRAVPASALLDDFWCARCHSTDWSEINMFLHFAHLARTVMSWLFFWKQEGGVLDMWCHDESWYQLKHGLQVWAIP